MKKKHLSIHELNKLIGTIVKRKTLNKSDISGQDNKFYKRNFCIVLLGFECGLRVSEICNTRIDDFNEEDGTMYCRRGKGSVKNVLKISSILSKEIVKLIEGRSDGYMFISRQGGKLTRQSINGMFKKYCDLCGIDESLSHFHTLKHTCAMYRYHNGFSIDEVKYMLGHRKIENTMYYLQLEESCYGYMDYKIEHNINTYYKQNLEVTKWN